MITLTRGARPSRVFVHSSPSRSRLEGFVVFVLALLLFSGGVADAATFSGRTLVLDADTVILSGWLVRHGLAYRHYSTRYVAEEDETKALKRGMWAGTFTQPWEWRKGKRSH